MIILDEPWTKALKEESEDRCHRIGQKNNVTIYTLICKDTIDERVHSIVKKKGAMGDALVDKQYDLKNPKVLSFLLTGEGTLDK